jgi:hypothetical protein
MTATRNVDSSRQPDPAPKFIATRYATPIAYRTPKIRWLSPNGNTLVSDLSLRRTDNLCVKAGGKSMQSRDTARTRDTPMRWADTLKTAALTVLAERKASTDPVSVDTPWIWNPYDVWLSRVRPPREFPAQPAVNDPATQSREGTA